MFVANLQQNKGGGASCHYPVDSIEQKRTCMSCKENVGYYHPRHISVCLRQEWTVLSFAPWNIEPDNCNRTGGHWIWWSGLFLHLWFAAAASIRRYSVFNRQLNFVDKQSGVQWSWSVPLHGRESRWCKLHSWWYGPGFCSHTACVRWVVPNQSWYGPGRSQDA